MVRRMHSPLQIAPLTGWQNYQLGPLGELSAFLTMEERRAFAWMAQEVYSGAGEIVDAGAWLGGSARCFAHGLQANQRVELKDGRIHSFDMFRKFRGGAVDVAPAMQALSDGDTFLDQTHDQLGELDSMVTLYPGDITARTWRGGPIELLMLDCSKAAVTDAHCLRQFFPALIPNRSYVLHQDYGIVSNLWWIHASMYLLRDHFAFSGDMGRGGTVLFKCVKEITAVDVEAALGRLVPAVREVLAEQAALFMEPAGNRCANAIRETSKAFGARSPAR